MKLTTTTRTSSTTTTRTSSLVRRVAATMGALAIAGSVMLTGATQASADTTVYSWSYKDYPVRCVDSNGVQVYICLYYNTGANGAKYMGEDTMAESTITGTFWADQWGSAGGGQKVRNDAASVENPTWCTDVVYVYPWFTGDANYIPAGQGGNLAWPVSNNEASWATKC